MHLRLGPRFLAIPKYTIFSWTCGKFNAAAEVISGQGSKCFKVAIVVVPPLMRDLTGGRALVAAPGTTVGQVLMDLDSAYPGFRRRLCQGDDLNPHIGVVVDGVLSELRLLQPVGEDSEIRFLPALQGG